MLSKPRVDPTKALSFPNFSTEEAMKDHILGADAREWQDLAHKTVLATEGTGGNLSVVDMVCQPGFGPPRHIHHDADETFLVLSGDMEFWMEGKTKTVCPGGAVFVPRGKEHAFRIVSNTPCRHLVIFTPGGFEGFFSEMSAGQLRIPEDMPQVKECGTRYHMTFTGPPIGVE